LNVFQTSLFFFFHRQESKTLYTSEYEYDQLIDLSEALLGIS